MNIRNLSHKSKKKHVQEWAKSVLVLYMNVFHNSHHIFENIMGIMKYIHI